MIKIFQQETPIGTLDYNNKTKLFTFVYHKNFKGYNFGDLNIEQGREIVSFEIPSMFDIDDSYTREKTIEKLNIKSLSKQEANWEILKDTARRKSGFKGFKFE